ncbi:MAG: FHA domain-containing protein, partial [Chloroflexota bacterium]
MFEVRVEAGDAEKFRQTLSEGQYHLGRAADNEITIPDKSLSRRHLRLEVTAGGVTLTDLGSTNGTYLDGRRLPPHQPTPWPPGETAQVGPLSLHLRQAGERGSRGVGEQGS